MAGEKKLTRSRRDRVIGGVLGGIAEYFNIDSTLLRLVYIFISFFSIKGAALLYLVLYLVIPDEMESHAVPINFTEKNNKILGITLILLGLVLFFNELYHFLTFKLIWPSLIIILGFYLLFKGIMEQNNERG